MKNILIVLFLLGFGFIVGFGVIPGISQSNSENEDRSRPRGEEKNLWLGISACRNKKIEVLEVFPGTPAEEAGLKRGDRILEIDDHSVARIAHAKRILHRFASGDEIAVLLERPTGEWRVRVTLNQRPGTSLRAGTEVFLPADSWLNLKTSELEPDDPALQTPSCLRGRSCKIKMNSCQPLSMEAQTPLKTTLVWNSHRIFFEGDWRGRTYLTKADCERDAQSQCGSPL